MNIRANEVVLNTVYMRCLLIIVKQGKSWTCSIAVNGWIQRTRTQNTSRTKAQVQRDTLNILTRSSVQIKWSSGHPDAQNCRRTTWTSQQVIRGTTRLTSTELELNFENFLFCYCCFLVLSVLWFLSLALNVGHLVLFLLFYLSLDCYYHWFVGVFCSPHQVGLPCLFPKFVVHKTGLFV